MSTILGVNACWEEIRKNMPSNEERRAMEDTIVNFLTIVLFAVIFAGYIAKLARDAMIELWSKSDQKSESRRT